MVEMVTRVLRSSNCEKCFFYFCIFLLFFLLGRSRKPWHFLLEGSWENHLPHVCMSLINETVQGRRTGVLAFKLESSDCEKWQDFFLRDIEKQKSECRRE